MTNNKLVKYAKNKINVVGKNIKVKKQLEQTKEGKKKRN